MPVGTWLPWVIGANMGWWGGAGIGFGFGYGMLAICGAGAGENLMMLYVGSAAIAIVFGTAGAIGGAWYGKTNGMCHEHLDFTIGLWCSNKALYYSVSKEHCDKAKSMARCLMVVSFMH